MKSHSKIACALCLFAVACSDASHEVSDLQIEAAKNCLELEQSRSDLSAKLSNQIASNSVTERDLIGLIDMLRQDIEEKNRCLKRYKSGILNTDELSVEFSQYLSDVSSARSLLVVSTEQWSEADSNHVREVLGLALEYIDKVGPCVSCEQ